MSKEMKTLTIGGSTYEIVDEKARERLDNLVLDDGEGGVGNYYVTPEQYGAVGDGVTDDTEAFDAAIVTGMPVILGKKSYMVSGFVFERDVDIRGNETTILATGKEYSETSGLHVFACLEPLNIRISGVNIRPINHIVSIMTFNSVSSVHISNCELDGCTVNENGEYTTDGSNRGIGCDSCTNVTIKDSYIHNMYGMGVSFMSSTDIVLTNCRIEDTGRGGAYILSNNKNVNIENNIFRNNVRCYTVGDGSLDVYGTSNNEVRLTNNYIEGFGCEGTPSCGIRIKGSDNVVCEKNTIRTTADTYFLAAILICERYGIETTNCILRDNDILVEEIASSDIEGYLIRVTDQCDIKNLMILNNTMQTTVSKYGISLRRGMEDVLIDGNYIKATLAIVVYNQEGYIRKNLRITNNSIYGAIDINHCYNTILNNNIVISDYSKPVNIANSDVLHIDGNTFTMDKDIAMSNCTNSFIGDNNTYIKSDSVSRSKKEFEIMIREESGQQITIPNMKATPSIKYYGDSVADESATVENMVEYTIFNKNGDLILNVGEQTLTDSVPKYAIRTKQKDLANYIDENGNAYISDYRDWENGVDWHYIRELVITGNETLYSSFPLIAYRLDQNWKESGIPYIGMYADNTPGFVRYDTPFVSNFYYRYSETDSTVNLPIYIASAKLLCIYPQNYNSSLKQFETEESWYAWCKEKYNAGTPLKVLYALYEPYTTPIPEDELAAYKALTIDGSDVEITSNANKKFEVSYFIDDMYTRGVKQLIDKAIPNKTSQLENDSGFITAEDIPEGNFSQFIEQTADSVNLYPPMIEGWTNNATLKSDGSENPNTSGAYCITPPISVLPNTTYTIKPVPWGSLADANRGRTYNESGIALAKLSWIENADSTVSFTTPENASYIRFTIYKTNFDNSNSNITDIDVIIPIFNSVFMLVKGTTAPEEYEAFGEGKYRLKDIEIPLKSVSLENVNDKALPIFAPLASKKIANFGDSIFGNARPPEDVSTYLAEKTGAEVLNCAFGGCRMSQHTGHWDAFSMYRLAYAIANNDYSLQDEALNYDDRTSYAAEPLALIKATDFSTVDILTIGYGTNDFTGNNTLDNSENPLDTSTVCGALRYSIERLLSAYPNLRIVILSLTYRFWADDNNVYTEDSNSRANGKGDTILNYNAKLKEVAEEYNLPFVDNYNIGIGKFNRTQYFSATDGTHHQIEGRKLIAEHLAGALTNAPNTTPNKTELVNDVLNALNYAEGGTY